MRPAEFVLSIGGIGRLRPASGTWASFATAAVIVAAIGLGAPASAVNIGVIGAILVMSLVCIALTGTVERELGRTDPSLIVADEVAGQALALLLAPWHLGTDGLAWNIGVALGAFLLFRLFDIWKPWPIRALQHLPAGWGVLLDDLAAAALAWGILRVVVSFVEQTGVP